MKPFIPDYIPAVGDIDSFLKVPHPEGKKDGLGLTVLDEPSAQQSDPTVLDMRLRLASKQTNLKVSRMNLSYILWHKCLTFICFCSL